MADRICPFSVRLWKVYVLFLQNTIYREAKIVLAVLFQRFVHGIVQFRTNPEQLVIRSRRIDPVGQKNDDDLVHRIDDNGCARKAGMAKCLL